MTNNIVHATYTATNTANFAALKKQVKEAGLLEKQPGYMLHKIILTLVMLAVSIILLFVSDNFWLQMLNALYMGFTFGQFGFIAHDVGHRQGFRSTKLNDAIGLFYGGILLGMSYDWWYHKHNQHHAHPNQHDLDPDIDFPMFAFTQEDARTKTGFYRFMAKHQARLFLFLLPLNAINLRNNTATHLALNQSKKYRWLEVCLVIMHFIWLPGVLLVALPWTTAVLFYILQQAVWGGYMAFVFAPNHKGMPIFAADAPVDYLHLQILTARNIRAHPITDFWYGGLNYQIEHHLFPTMAQNNLAATQKIVKAYCAEHNIPYYETSLLGSYREILAHLREASSPLREPLSVSL